jgi:hypothetical protein
MNEGWRFLYCSRNCFFFFWLVVRKRHQWRCCSSRWQRMWLSSGYTCSLQNMSSPTVHLHYRYGCCEVISIITGGLYLISFTSEGHVVWHENVEDILRYLFHVWPQLVWWWATGLVAMVWFLTRIRDSLPYSIKTASGVLPGLLPSGYWSSFWGIKQPRCAPSAKVTIGGAIPPVPHVSSWYNSWTSEPTHWGGFGGTSNDRCTS